MTRTRAVAPASLIVHVGIIECMSRLAKSRFRAVAVAHELFSHASALLVPRCCECRRVSLRRFGCVFCRHKGSGTWFLGWLGVWGVLPCVCQELYCGILLDNDYQEKRIKELCRAENVRPEKMQRLLKQGKALL